MGTNAKYDKCPERPIYSTLRNLKSTSILLLALLVVAVLKGLYSAMHNDDARLFQAEILTGFDIKSLSVNTNYIQARIYYL